MINRLIFTLLFLISTNSYASLISGNLNSLPESQGAFSWGDGVNNLHQEWSIAVFNHSGWFYGSDSSESNADVFVYKGLTDISLAGDASLFNYQIAGAVAAAEGDTVFFRGVNQFYGAWKIDSIDGFNGFGNYPYGYLSGTWYFLEDGKSNFSTSEVSEPSLIYLSIFILFVLLLRDKYFARRSDIAA
jgi:hypothetical protein